MESIPAIVTHRYLVLLARHYCLMLLWGVKLQCGDLAGYQWRCYSADMTTQNVQWSWEPVLTSSEVANKAQAGAIDNWGTFKCFDHNRFPQFLFSSPLSQDSLPRENLLVITYSLNFWRIFKQKHLSALKICLLSLSCTEFRQIGVRDGLD